MPRDSALQYDDFDIQILPPDSAGRYPVSVRSPAGAASALLTLPFSREELASVKREMGDAVMRSVVFRQSVRPEQQPAQRFGRRLFEALVGGDVHDRWLQSRTMADLSGRGLRLRLLAYPPEVAGLPWELLWDPAHRGYVALERRTPLLRYLAPPGMVSPLRVELPLRILAMDVQPDYGEDGEELGHLETSAEREGLERAVERLRQQGVQVELDWVEGGTADHLRDALREHRPHIFHFIGHSGFDEERDEGYLILTDARGREVRLHAEDVAVLLTNYARPAVAVLNSCEGARGGDTDPFSATAAILTLRGLPAVVAMQYPISDGAATEFSRSLYGALASYEPIDAAVTEARFSVRQKQQSLEWATAVLHMCSPDGRVLEPPDTTRGDGAVEPPALIALRPDGGEYRNLEEAVRALGPGGTISLAPGTYDLERGVLLDRPVTITGAGADTTIIQAASGAQVLRYEGSGLLRLHDLTVRWPDGAAPAADVVTVTGGTVDMARCRFTGAAGAAPGIDVGAGLRFLREVRGSVTSCTCTKNDYGVVVFDRAQVLLTENTCSENRVHGVLYSGAAAGRALDNVCSWNGQCGVMVASHAAPTLEGNTCRHNTLAGMALGDFSRGVARRNICSENKRSGIIVVGQAEVELEGNTCRDNKEAGIAFIGSSKGVARGNRSGGNLVRGKKGGIVVQDGAKPELVGNIEEK